MPVTPPAPVRSALPRLSLYSRAIFEAILLTGGSVGSEEVVAQRLGLRNRFELARLLQRDGLPSLRCLADWVTLLAWVKRAERQSTSLCRMAFTSGRHPSACYRLVRELTGLRWTEVLAKGSKWVEGELLRELGERFGT
jgi:hypothetical protein